MPAEGLVVPSAEACAAVDRLVANALDALALTPEQRRQSVHDEVAYRRTITTAKRDQWLNTLAGWVSEHLEGNARMAAWEAIEVRRSCGTRARTPPDVRHAVDQLSRLRASLQQHPLAEAAE